MAATDIHVVPPPPPVEDFSPTTQAKASWMKIADFALSKPRVWEEHKLEEIPAQRIIHHTYEHTTGRWSQQEGLCKMETKPFDRGSMRECFRMICTDPFGESHSSVLDWKHIPASVAKRYFPVKRSQLEWSGPKNEGKKANLTVTRPDSMASFVVGDMVEANYGSSGSWYPAVVRAVNSNKGKHFYTVYYPDDDEEETGLLPSLLRKAKTESLAEASTPESKLEDDALVEVPRDAYFTDVTLLMATRPFEQAFNMNKGLASAGLKQIHFLHAHVIEVLGEEGEESKIFAAERFISGKYVKHNSNTGFVEEHHRRTPQAFSHFSFAMSGGYEMVVDIQGVGDLWTDPQLHSADYKYGSGDLGTNGMALFFATHECGGLCQSLGLNQFNMCPTQRRRMKRGDLDGLCKHKETTSPVVVPEGDPLLDLKESMELLDSMVNTTSPDGGSGNRDEKLALAQVAAAGETHLALASYHKQGRFTHEDTDGGAVIYHLHAAAKHGEPHALWALAQAYSGLSHNLLPLQPTKQDRVGFDMSLAAPPFASIPEDVATAVRLLVALGNLDERLMNTYNGDVSNEPYRVAAMMRLAKLSMESPELATGAPAYEWATRVWASRQAVEGSLEAANGLLPMSWHEVAGLIADACEAQGKKEEAADWLTRAADDATEEGLFGVADNYMRRCESRAGRACA